MDTTLRSIYCNRSRHNSAIFKTKCPFFYPKEHRVPSQIKSNPISIFDLRDSTWASPAGKVKKNNTTTEKANKWQKYCHCSVAMEMTAYLHIMATNHNTHTESRKAKQHPFKVFIWRPTSGPASLVFLTPKRRLPFEGKTKWVLKIRAHDAHVHLSALKNTWIKPGQRCQRVNTSLVFQVTSSHI